MQPSSVLLNATPEPQTVRDQLARILASRDFLVPQRVQGFLTYVVDETLAGRGDRLKAIAIATDVFGRGLDFDAMNDPVVRIEAGRLRRALERYYLLSGSDDPVIIDIPKGTYIPTFTQREGARVAEEPVVAGPSGQELPAAHPGIPKRRWLSALLFAAFAVAVLTAATWPRKLEEQRPKPRATAPEITLAVAPFSNLAGPATGLFAAGVFEELLAELARFRELRIVRAEVVSPPSTNGGPLPTPQYRLEGSVRGGEQLRVTARLVDVESSRIVWSQIYERDLSNARIFDIEADIATKVAIAVAQPYGAIFGSQGTAADVPGSADAYQCVLRFYQYRKVLSPVEHASTRACLERTTEQHPNYSTDGRCWPISILTRTALD